MQEGNPMTALPDPSCPRCGVPLDATRQYVRCPECNASLRDESAQPRPSQSLPAADIKCFKCGLRNFAGATACRRCGVLAEIAFVAPPGDPRFRVATAAAPYAVNPAEFRNTGGKTCSRCGLTNSYSTTNGTTIVLTVILFITCIGILAIPFLPKTWYCRYCSNIW